METDEISVRELLELCLRLDDQAHWAQFVRRVQPLVASVIINTVRRWRDPHPALVDDLIQETFLKLFAVDRKALRSIKNEHENTIFGYLKVVASNVVRDHFRGKGQKVMEIELTDQVVPQLPDGFDVLEFQRRKDKIEELLHTLSATANFQRDHTIFWLFYGQGYTAKEISLLPAINLSVKGVESTLLRLVRFLRDGLNELDRAAGSQGR